MEKRDWKKLVAESKGNMVFVPGKLTDSFKTLDLKRQKFLEVLEGVSKTEIELQVETNNLMLEVRKLLAESGLKIWKKDIGLNQSAMEDNELILNISDPRG